MYNSPCLKSVAFVSRLLLLLRCLSHICKLLIKLVPCSISMRTFYLICVQDCKVIFCLTETVNWNWGFLLCFCSRIFFSLICLTFYSFCCIVTTNRKVYADTLGIICANCGKISTEMWNIFSTGLIANANTKSWSPALSIILFST